MADDEPDAPARSQWLPPVAPGRQSPPSVGSPPPSPASRASPAGGPSAPPAGGAPLPPAYGQPLGPLPPAPPGPPANDRAVLTPVLGIGGLVAFLGARLGLFFIFNLPPSIAPW